MRSLVFVLLLAFSLAICNAQSTVAKPVEPTAIGVIYHLDPSGQALKPLPDEQWKKETCSNNMFSHYFLCVEVSGERSSFRLKNGDKADFAFNTGSPEKVSLYRFVLKKKRRQFEYLEHHPASPEEYIKGLPIETTKYGESSFKLAPISLLAPGEYAIIIAGEIYTFGVDQ